MTRNDITDRYLRQITQHASAGMEQRSTAFEATSYHGRYLSRPAFLAHHEVTRLAEDLTRLHGALAAIPARLFDGDLGAFARAAGMAEPQVEAILRAQGQPLTRLARADMYHDGTNFQIMELNMGSTVGGLDNADLNRVFLGFPTVAEFVDEHKLSYVDTMAELAGMLTGYHGDQAFVVAVDWPASYQTLEPQLRASADTLRGLGVDITVGHLGQLRYRDGRVWLDGEDRPIDVIYRVFMIEDLLDPVGPELIDPVLRAAERGEVAIFTPIDVELYGSKAALAMLSDERNRDLFADDELASLDRVLPWTRMVRAELIEYAMREREQLVLKPAMLHGGLGVVLGWDADPELWRHKLTEAIDGPYVLQRRIPAPPEPFPSESGLRPLLLKWNVFTVDSGYGGAMVGGTPDLTGSVLNSAGGATLGCCFHQER